MGNDIFYTEPVGNTTVSNVPLTKIVNQADHKLCENHHHPFLFMLWRRDNPIIAFAYRLIVASGDIVGIEKGD